MSTRSALAVGLALLWLSACTPKSPVRDSSDPLVAETRRAKTWMEVRARDADTLLREASGWGPTEDRSAPCVRRGIHTVCVEETHGGIRILSAINGHSRAIDSSAFAHSDERISVVRPAPSSAATAFLLRRTSDHRICIWAEEIRCIPLPWHPHDVAWVNDARLALTRRRGGAGAEIFTVDVATGAIKEVIGAAGARHVALSYGSNGAVARIERTDSTALYRITDAARLAATTDERPLEAVITASQQLAVVTPYDLRIGPSVTWTSPPSQYVRGVLALESEILLAVGNERGDATVRCRLPSGNCAIERNAGDMEQIHLGSGVDNARVTSPVRPPRAFDDPPRPTEFEATIRMAVSDDGTEIPITEVHRRSASGPMPTLMFVYGAYGTPLDPSFDPRYAPLLERGMRLAFAHVRGGGERGPHWHRSGAGRNKHRAIEDVTTCAKMLRNSGLASRLALSGRSAGGLIALAAADHAPDLYQALVLESPLIDLSAMLEKERESAPREIDEWGDPRLPFSRAAIERLSPVGLSGALPAVFMWLGLKDSVINPEPASRFFVSRRASGKLPPESVMIIDPHGQHEGPATDADRHRLEAYENLFLLEQLMTRLE